MAAPRNEHLVVVMLAPMPIGEEFEIWDRHITIVPWFPVDDDVRLDGVLSEVAARHSKLSVSAGGLEEWGRREKYPVQLIDDHEGLDNLHQDMFENLENSGFPIHQKDFMGHKYTPHVALRNRLQKGKPIPPGTRMEIDNFTLIKQVRLKGSGRMIKTPVRNYGLG